VPSARARRKATAPAVFSWIGVTMHLGLTAVKATLATVAGARGHPDRATCNQLQAVLQGSEAHVGAVLARLADDLGEPFVSLLTPSTLRRHRNSSSQHHDSAAIVAFRIIADALLPGTGYSARVHACLRRDRRSY
jgi:hypothetical protein